ncbi:Sulfate permease 2, partial [Kappamyces sp. JEL0680]
MAKITSEKVQHFVSDARKNGASHLGAYIASLFPILTWIQKYNTTWLMGDVLAGLTVGFLVIPQALSYAKLAGVPLQYGLYTSFMGVLVYPFFATSKDVTI